MSPMVPLRHAIRLRPVLAVAALLVGAAARPVAAQSLGLTPAEIRATFKPRQVLQFDVAVSNEGDTPVPMRGSVMDLWFDPTSNEKVFAAPGTTPHSASNWMTFVPATFTVPPHGTAKIKLVITPPADAVGGSYAVLFVESKPELARAASGDSKPIFANLRLGALVLLSAAGTERFGLDVGDISLTPPDGDRKLEMTVPLTNTGNTHVFPQARLAVLNAGRQVVARAEGETRRFFPGQTDSLRLTWAGSLEPGDYTAVLTIAYGADKVYTEERPLHVSP